MTNENTKFDLEWMKCGGVILAGYSQENTGEGGSFDKTFLIKMLAHNIFIEMDVGEGFACQESFEPREIDGFCIDRMATREECVAVGIEYIERPVSASELASLREDKEMLEFMIKTPALWVEETEDGFEANAAFSNGAYRTFGEGRTTREAIRDAMKGGM